MAGTTAEELEGNTLTVYAYIVHVDKPVGTRDVTRGADLSSTSVAHRHLQKLEDFGLIEKKPVRRLYRKRENKCKWTCVDWKKPRSSLNIFFFVFYRSFECRNNNYHVELFYY